jgi:hypothetical protein
MATYEDFFKKYGTGARGGSAIGIARGTSPGTVDPMLRGMTNEQLAELDRLQFNRQVTGQNPLAGAVGGIGLTVLDLIKGTGVQNQLGPIIELLGGSEEAAKEFSLGPNTSKPSISQAVSNLRGVGMGLSDILDVLRGQ